MIVTKSSDEINIVHVILIDHCYYSDGYMLYLEFLIENTWRVEILSLLLRFIIEIIFIQYQ